ncbi:MAG: recombinase family protein [Xanthobacteraceae bacterium]
MTTIGYARVSTDGQSLEAQHSALADAGCAKVFAEKQSGAKTDRAQLAKAIAALAEGDTLIVCKLDRLARSTRDLLNTLAAIAEKGATFKSLGDPWCDTTTPHGRLMLTVRRPTKSTSSCQLTLGNNQSSSSNFLASVSNSGGNSFGTS